jgi:hypothetical protein
MADHRLRVKNTNQDALIGNIRGEVGEAITNWILLRHLIGSSKELETDDISVDMKNENLAFVYALKGRIKGDLILTLAGLAERKTDRATFFFAVQKINALHSEEEIFRKYIEKNKLKQKRDREIAHREQPLDWPAQGDIRISYSVLTKSLAKAIRLMKKIDTNVIGDKAITQWHKMRKTRYDLTMPARAKYLLLEYMAGE